MYSENRKPPASKYGTKINCDTTKQREGESRGLSGSVPRVPGGHVEYFAYQDRV